MSKLEVREIGPISGETDLKLGQSGGTVTLADGATAVGFGDPNNLDIVQYVSFDRTKTYSINVWHVITESQIQIPEDGIYMVTAQTSWHKAGDLKSVRAAIYTAESVTPLANGEDGRCLNNTHWYTSQGGTGNRGENNASVTQRVFNGVGGYWVWLETLQDNTPNSLLPFVSNSYIELVRLK